MTQVLENDVLAIVAVEVIFDVVGSAVLPIGETLFFDELRVAGGAAPRHESRRDVHEALEAVGVLVELFNEVKGTRVTRAIPNLDVSHVFLLTNGKLCRKSRSILLLSKLNEHVAVGLPNEHRRDPDACTGAIIAHDDIGDIFDPTVNNNEQAGAGTLRIAHLVHEGAPATLRHDYLRGEGLECVEGDGLLELLDLLRVTLLAHVLVLVVKVNRTNLGKKTYKDLLQIREEALTND